MAQLPLGNDDEHNRHAYVAQFLGALGTENDLTEWFRNAGDGNPDEAGWLLDALLRALLHSVLRQQSLEVAPAELAKAVSAFMREEENLDDFPVANPKGEPRRPFTP